MIINMWARMINGLLIADTRASVGIAFALLDLQPEAIYVDTAMRGEDFRRLTAQDVHETYNKVLRENDVLLYQAGMAAPRLTSWDDLSIERKVLYRKMAELLNNKSAEEVLANASK